MHIYLVFTDFYKTYYWSQRKVIVKAKHAHKPIHGELGSRLPVARRFVFNNNLPLRLHVPHSYLIFYVRQVFFHNIKDSRQLEFDLRNMSYLT